MENSNPTFSASAASSSSSPPKEYYDVFLSFRGEDTRNNFTGHLRDALRQKGFHTFFDDDKLERGKEINPELLKAIEDSRCSIVVLSENYAYSSWCLTELAKIVECKGTSSGNILPIFYHVDPGLVRNQSGSYGEAFKKHEEDAKHNSQMVQSWRDALKNVGNLAGWHVTKDKLESEFIKEFIGQLSTKLDVPTLNIKVLFGIDSRLKKFTSCFVSPSSDSGVQFIGICGMGGIGKTTLAKAYYNKNFNKFDGGCFLANVREVCKNQNGLVYLQTQLLSNILKDKEIEIENVDTGVAMIKRRLQHKRVLIILDDVTKAEQLEALVDHKDEWFGSGSIVVVTSRDKSLLTSNGISTIHETEILNSREALQLFSWKAFKNINPPENFKDLCKQVMEYAKDLPLAVAVLGSILRGKSANEWESALNRLKKYQKKEIVEVLKVSFDDLEEIDQHLFLDIACFFNEHDKDNVIQVLDSCGFDSKYGISNLIGKSLLNIRHNELHMHDLLQDMGKKIVQKESPNEPGGQSRIWDVNDFFHILENETGTNKIEAIVTFQEGSRKLSSFKAMSDMKNLRLLMILDPYNFSYENESLTPDFEYLSDGQLRLLQWDRFPYKCFPPSFRPYRLVQLKLVCSRIEKLWNNHTKPLHNLKIIDLSYSEYFSKFEDFRVVPNLERLILEGCKVLLEIDDSITSLEKLISLNLASCKSLKKLPNRIIGMKSLEILNLNSCFELHELPDDCGHLKSLKEVDVRGSGISHLPSSIFLIENLKVFSDVDVVYSSSKRFNFPDNYNDDNQDGLEINLDIGDDDTAVYKVQAAGEALQEDSELSLLAKRTLEGYNSSYLIRQVSQELKHFRTSEPKSTSTWPSIEKCFDELTCNSNGLLPSSLFGECLGINKEFASKLFGALAQRRNISGDSINKTQLWDFWKQLSDESFDSRLQTFFDILSVDKDADGRMTEEDVRKMIILSASANKVTKIQEHAEESAALIMEELDPDNVGYVMIDNLATLLLRPPSPLRVEDSQNLSQMLSQELEPVQENTNLKRWYMKSKYFLIDNWASSKAPVERLINRAFGSSLPVKILKVAIYPGNVMALDMTKPQGFKYKSGQYMFVNCAAVSQFGWHPFYISSSPGDSYLSVHIQALSKWAQKLKTMFSEICQPPLANVQGGYNQPRFPKILIHGPYGVPAQDYKKYEVVLLVGLGIGAAPMVSILKDILNNLTREEDHDEALWVAGGGGGGLESSTGRKAKSSNKGTGFRTRKAYCYWVTRDMASFEWFKWIMNAVAEIHEKDIIEVHNYCISVYEEGDARSALVAMLQSLHHAKNGVDVVSGSRCQTHFARPNWRQVYKRIAHQHPDARVGVFYCGSSALSGELSKLASDFSHNSSTKFEFLRQNYFK